MASNLSRFSRFLCVAILTAAASLTATTTRADDIQLRSGVLDGLTVRSYTITVGADLTTMAAVIGAPDAHLMVSVYDENGNLLDSDLGSKCAVQWTPRWRGQFTIKVANLDGAPHFFTLGVK